MFNLDAFLSVPLEELLSVSEIIEKLHLEKELELYNNGYDYILGFDEAGRGAWAGGIIVGSTMLPFFVLRQKFCTEKFFFNVLYKLLSGVKDSKKLTAKKREKFLEKIDIGMLSSYCITPNSSIDTFGITKATQTSMNKAFLNVMDVLNTIIKLPQLPNIPPPNQNNTAVLFDYGLFSDFMELSSIKSLQFIHGEDISMSIAAASIVAKVYRDREMDEIHTLYPEYDFINNKGYHSKKHVQALKEHGRLKLHRASYGEISQYPLNLTLYK